MDSTYAQNGRKYDDADDEGLAQMQFEREMLNKRRGENRHRTSTNENERNENNESPRDQAQGHYAEKDLVDDSKKEDISTFVRDLQREDRIKRTVFHRAALEQNVKLLTQLCAKVKDSNFNGEYIKLINKTDIFENTPIICACMQNVEGQEQRRKQCLEILLKASANPNAKNKKSRWGAINWCAFYGDHLSLSLLLEYDTDPCLPDYNGFFPIDIAGKSKKKDAVFKLLEKMIGILDIYENTKPEAEKNPDILVQKFGSSLKYLESTYLRTSCLYWGVKYGVSQGFLDRILKLPKLTPEMPMFQDHMKNCFHAACEGGTSSFLERIFNFRKKLERNPDGTYVEELKLEKNLFKMEDYEIDHKKKFFSKNFIAHWKKMNIWFSDLRKTLEDIRDPKAYEYQDNYGNTPLHIASLKGYVQHAQFLLEKHVNVNIENIEGWRCIELKQHEEIKQLYQKFQKKREEKIQKKGIQISPFARTISSLSSALDAIEDSYFEQRTIPDLVIIFKIPDFQDPRVASINFTIKVLADSFDSYMFIGVDNRNYYLMIKMDDKMLSEECMKLGLKMKLLDDYNYEVFDQSRETDFEPFRSRQRQEITLNSLKKIIDVDRLIDQNIIHKIYLMHTVSGANKIRELWMSFKKLQPLVEYKDYLTEGKHLNFKALTILRQYFGEKIGFFFAWSSFCVIYLLPLALPGLVIAAIAYRTDFTGNTLQVLIPLWVIYNVLATTFVTEKWKRKESEIATRWGVLDMLNNTNVDKQIRKEYVGDEVISDVTGGITKKSDKSKTVIIFILSIPILLLLLAGVIVVFIYTNNNPDISKFVGGIINGVVITVLNYLYGNLARYFVAEENHKYFSSHERSLILKTFLFKFLNSFLGVFYIAFYRDGTTLSSLSDTLLSLTITRQASSYLTANIIPMVTFWWRKRKYFKLVQQEAEQADLNRSTASIDNFGKEEKKEHVLRRAVLNCKTGTHEKEWELAQVELEALKNSEKDLIDHYGDMLIQLGYITMFAAAFPIGPLLAIVLNLILVRGKLYAFLTALKRPTAQKSGGLGDWLFVWEIMSVISIYTNAGLLYFRTDVTFYGDNEGDTRLWAYIVAIHVVLVSKYLVIFFIADKPKWVITEEEKQEFQQEKAIDEMKDREAKQLKAEASKFKKYIQKKELLSPQIQLNTTDPSNKSVMVEEPKQVVEEIIDTPKDKSTARLAQILSPHEETDSTKPFKYIIWNTYNLIERKLLIIRMSEIALHTHNILIKCVLCRAELAVAECSTCNEEFCKKCLVGIHNKVNISSHKVIMLTEQSKLKAGASGYKETTEVKIKSQTEEKKNRKSLSNFGDSTVLWRKFETFSFPTQRMTEYHGNLKKCFDMLKKIYIHDNWISDDNTIIDIAFIKNNNKMFKNMNNLEMEILNEKRGDQSQTFQKFIECDDLNLEEKFILNKIAFLNFKRRGAKAKFVEVFRQIKIFQEGSLESKLFLLFDMLDEDEDNYVSMIDCLNFLQPRFFQNLRFENEIESALVPLFEGMTRLEKKDFFTIFLDKPVAREIMSVALQILK